MKTSGNMKWRSDDVTELGQDKSWDYEEIKGSWTGEWSQLKKNRIYLMKEEERRKRKQNNINKLFRTLTS